MFYYFQRCSSIYNSISKLCAITCQVTKAPNDLFNNFKIGAESKDFFKSEMDLMANQHGSVFRIPTCDVCEAPGSFKLEFWEIESIHKI